MEPYIPVSFLNDFIFCPRSIYFHQLYQKFDELNYKDIIQFEGEAAHTSITTQKYSSKKNLLQNLEVYSEKYNIGGKVDIFNIDTGTLIERKKEIKVIYDGYIFQVYAHYFALKEMGYNVKKIILYDLTHNKNYNVKLPEVDIEMFKKFENLIQLINHYDLFNSDFKPNPNKCARCIYKELCDFAIC